WWLGGRRIRRRAARARGEDRGRRREGEPRSAKTDGGHTSPLSLRAGERDALHELFLEDEEHDDERKRPDHGAGHDEVPYRTELLLEKGQAERQCVET